MTVWLYVDEFSSMAMEDAGDSVGKTGREMEYEEIEGAFRKRFGPDVVFRRDMDFLQLRNGSPDVYLWDIGGMCRVDIGGSRRDRWCAEVVRQIEDHPSTVFVPWSQFTQGHASNAMYDLIGEEAFDERRFPPNVVLLDSSERNRVLYLEGPLLDRVEKLCRK